MLIMHLNNLKPAWSRLKLRNSLPGIEPGEVLQIIESGEKIVRYPMQRMVNSSVIFLVLLIGCHGG